MPQRVFGRTQSVMPHVWLRLHMPSGSDGLETARRTYEQEQRRELYAAVFQQIATEVPVVFLYFADYLYAQNRSVKGLKIAPVSDPTARFWDVEDWYVKTVPRR